MYPGGTVARTGWEVNSRFGPFPFSMHSEHQWTIGWSRQISNSFSKLVKVQQFCIMTIHDSYHMIHMCALNDKKSSQRWRTPRQKQLSSGADCAKDPPWRMLMALQSRGCLESAASWHLGREEGNWYFYIFLLSLKNRMICFYMFLRLWRETMKLWGGCLSLRSRCASAAQGQNLQSRRRHMTIHDIFHFSLNFPFFIGLDILLAKR